MDLEYFGALYALETDASLGDSVGFQFEYRG